MNNISIRYKLLISFLILAFLLLPSSIYTIYSFDHLKNNFFDTIDNAVPRIRALLEIKSDSIRVNELINNFNSKENHSSNEIAKKKDELLAFLEDINQWEKEYKNHAVKYSSFNLKEFSKLKDQIIFAALDAFDDSEKGQSAIIMQQKKDKLEKVKNELNFFLKNAILDESLTLDEIKRNTIAQTNRVYRIIVVTSTSIFVVAIFLALFMANYISVPIIRLRDFSRSINTENLTQRAKVYSSDEIGELTVTLNKMLDDLHDAKLKLIDVSRQAGKAEIATSILHNVGNILNSVSVSSALLKEKTVGLKTSNLAKTILLLNENLDNIDDFINKNDKGKLVIPYLTQLTEQISTVQEELRTELDRLIMNIEDIKTIIATQQSYAKVTEVNEEIFIPKLLDDILNLYAYKIEHSNITVERNYLINSPVNTVKSKLQQILINLIKNSIDSLVASNAIDKKLIITVKKEDKLVIIVKDNGLGILPENLDKIFLFGFTTKSEGHGYGLHNCYLLAKELNGELSAYSDGANKGATFELKLKVD